MSYIAYRRAQPVRPVVHVRTPHSFAEYMDFGKKVISFFTQDVPETYGDMTKFMHNHFLRPANVSRLSGGFKQVNQSRYSALDGHQKERLFELLKNNGFVHEVLPAHNTFDIVLFLGGYLETMRQRLLFLDRLVASRQIILSDSCVMILTTGKRILEAGETSLYQGAKKRMATCSHLNDEEDGLRFIWHSTALCPQLRRMHVREVCVHNKSCRSKEGRPTTHDVFKHLMEKDVLSPHHRVLLVSSNPCVVYQALVLKALFAEKGMPVDLVDYMAADTSFYGDDLNDQLGLVLDSVARAFYQKGKLDAVKKHRS